MFFPIVKYNIWLCQSFVNIFFFFYADNFAVSENDGKIVTKIVLDRETQEQFIFTVYCENDGAPSHTVSTTVTVILEDVNDNKPIFKSATGYHGTYKEGDPRGIITLVTFFFILHIILIDIRNFFTHFNISSFFHHSYSECWYTAINKNCQI